MGALARAIGDPDGAELLDWLNDYIAALSAQGVANLSLAYSVGSSALTIAAKQQGGSNATTDQPIVANMRSATATSGDYNVRKITAAASVVVSSGSTLGHGNSDSRWVYVYLIEDGSSGLELAVSSKYYGEQGIVTTTAEGGAGGADSATAMYSTTSRSNTPYRCVGRFKAPQTVAGTWGAVPTSAEALHFDVLAEAVTADASANVFVTNHLGNSTNAVGVNFGSTGVFPSTGTGLDDNGRDLGSGTYRWRVVYAGTGTINTSDAREKTAVAALSAAEIAAAQALCREVGTFRFLAAVAQKGAAARMHIGMTVQRAIEVMQAQGLDPFAYGFICHDEWGADPAIGQSAGDRFAFRPDQLALFICAGLQARIAALEAAAAGAG